MAEKNPWRIARSRTRPIGTDSQPPPSAGVRLFMEAVSSSASARSEGSSPNSTLKPESSSLAWRGLAAGDAAVFEPTDARPPYWANVNAPASASTTVRSLRSMASRAAQVWATKSFCSSGLGAGAAEGSALPEFAAKPAEAGAEAAASAFALPRRWRRAGDSGPPSALTADGRFPSAALDELGSSGAGGASLNSSSRTGAFSALFFQLASHRASCGSSSSAGELGDPAPSTPPFAAASSSSFLDALATLSRAPVSRSRRLEPRCRIFCWRFHARRRAPERPGGGSSGASASSSFAAAGALASASWSFIRSSTAALIIASSSFAMVLAR
mmetsp:Transcript_5478/g.15518  ORF Transcript_5478/g.15518 Transcript_5478/m.15518 type:complete len:328 (+) Transcript_5478:946-1929(+)